MILCNNYTEGGSKSVDVKHKMLAIKCSWKQRLYNENSHEWKLIPLRYIKAFGKKFKFHPNLHISSDLICVFSSFVMRCAIWYHLSNLRNVKNTHGELLLLVKLQPKSLQLY